MEFEIVVRDLHTFKESRVVLPSERYIEELTQIFGDEWIEHDYDIVDVEDEYNLFNAFRLYGFESLDKLNKLATKINEVCQDNHSLKTLQAASEVYMDIDEVLELMEGDGLTLYEDHEPSDMAEWFVDEGWYGEINDKLLFYLDFEKIGRDLMLEGRFYATRFGILEQV